MTSLEAVAWNSNEAPPTDEELVARVRAGAFAAFEELVRRHAARVRRAVRAIVRDDHEAEDAAQQAFLQAFVGLRRFEGTASFSTWLVRIAMNEARMRARRARRDAPGDARDLETVPASEAVGPEQAAAAREAIALVRGAVHRLPEGHREAFRLRHVEGLSVAETALRLGITGTAVKLRLHRARAALRRALTAARPARDAGCTGPGFSVKRELSPSSDGRCTRNATREGVGTR